MKIIKLSKLMVDEPGLLKNAVEKTLAQGFYIQDARFNRHKVKVNMTFVPAVMLKTLGEDGFFASTIEELVDEYYLNDCLTEESFAICQQMFINPLWIVCLAYFKKYAFRLERDTERKRRSEWQQRIWGEEAACYE